MSDITPHLANFEQRHDGRPPEVFLDELGAVFVIVFTGCEPAPYAMFPLVSKQFRAWFTRQCRGWDVRRPSRGQWVEILDELDLRADEGERRQVFNRFARRDGAIFIDMADSANHVIRITEKGWTVCQSDQPHFYRYLHQRPLPEPVSDGELGELFSIIRYDDPSPDAAEFLPDDSQLMVAAWFVSVILQLGPTPILADASTQGAGKSTRLRRIRALVDPSEVDSLGEENFKNISLTFLHHAVAGWDNLGPLSRRHADAFCRAVTGAAEERRKLFTNSEQVLIRYRRPVLINATALPSGRPDFIERCLIMSAPRIPLFRTEDELDREFGQAHPRLLGVLLDLVVKTLVELPSTPAESEFRMCDFARCGRAVAKALGRTHDDFDTAYRDVIRAQAEETVEASPVAQVLSVWPAGKVFLGSATQLLERLTTMAKSNNISTTKSRWPSYPNTLSSELVELVSPLASRGVRIQRLPRKNNVRPWRIERVKDRHPA